MRFHTTNVSESDIYNAAKLAGVTVETLTAHRSNSHDKAYEIKLSGNSSRNSNGNDYKAATFDQWGLFIESLYRVGGNESMVVGNSYFDYYHFSWTFNNRYGNMLDGKDVEPCKQHKWEFDGFSATNSYRVQHCTKCEAVLRMLTVRQGENAKSLWLEGRSVSTV